MLITFEGIDGCGKSTQMKRLKEYLESKAYNVLSLREPGGTDFSEKIRELLLHSKYHINPRAELLLFEAARANLVETMILPAIQNGTIVLCDRFFDSTTAYQGYGRGIDIKEVMNCNLFATAGLVPALTFFLNIPIDIANRRAHYRFKDRIESAGDNFYEKVLDGFYDIARNEPERFVIIDAMGAIEETSAKIIEVINKKLQIA